MDELGWDLHPWSSSEDTIWISGILGCLCYWVVSIYSVNSLVGRQESMSRWKVTTWSRGKNIELSFNRKWKQGTYFIGRVDLPVSAGIQCLMDIVFYGWRASKVWSSHLSVCVRPYQKITSLFPIEILNSWKFSKRIIILFVNKGQRYIVPPMSRLFGYQVGCNELATSCFSRGGCWLRWPRTLQVVSIPLCGVV